MDTGLLRGFAGSARLGLLAGVGAQMGVVLAAGSEARAVSPELVAGLEREVASAGGGDVGRQVVADRVAYTWFNRITALRFMDAAGITSMKVVSPVPGGVQPEVLTAAKQGVFEDAVPVRDRERVTGFLTGALVSPNPDRDAYGVLLAAYCRWWNRAMPFLFERTADYTELLIPQDLLADDSVRDKAVKTLTAEVCEDVEVIGWLYQFYISDRKDEVFAGFKKGKKAGPAEIPAATQLFTPHWIVRYLVENSLGRLWLLNHPTSSIRGLMEYYIDPVDEETDYLRISSPEEIKVIDPACGSGHMLTYAFDLLYAIYEEEGYAPSDIPTLILQNNLFGTEIDERAGTLAAFALTMKARLNQKTFLTRKVTPHICVLRNITFAPDELDQLRHPTHHRADEDQFWNLFERADTFGSLLAPNETILTTAQAVVDALPDDDLLSDKLKTRAQTVVDQATYLSQRYHAMIANPPYMGEGNMSAALTSFAKSQYPGSKSDLFAMFIERSFSLCVGGGYSAMITMQSWMFLRSFEALRQDIVLQKSVVTLAHLGTGAFDSIGGDVVAVAAFVLRNARNASRSIFVRATGRKGELFKRNLLARAARGEASLDTFAVDQTAFSALPAAPMPYWWSESAIAAFRDNPPVSQTARIAKGLATGDNGRFLRQWWEVSKANMGIDVADRRAAHESGFKWFPYAKGGDYRKWAGNVDMVINWFNDGHEIQNTLTEDGSRIRATNLNLDRIFRPTICWTVVTTGAPSFRLNAAGLVYDSAAGLCQPDGDPFLLAAYLNSGTAAMLLQGLNPTINYLPGYVGSLPLPELQDPSAIADLARSAFEISLRDWQRKEVALGFSSPEWFETGSLRSTLISLQTQVWPQDVSALRTIEQTIDERFADALQMPASAGREVALHVNPAHLYGLSTAVSDARAQHLEDTVQEVASFAVGNMLGRYSLDRPGLVLADQGDSFETFLERVPGARFSPDRDNVIPIVDGDWFEDDIVARFREWLRVAFGGEHLQENWQYIEDTLGKSIRQYFVKDFYNDHVKRYKKRPIYWLFSSPKGTFNALIYLHRYTPSTAGTVLHDYVLPFLTKLETELGQQEHLTVTADTPRARAAATKQAEVLRKQMVEVRDWATNTLQPLADKQLAIDLDDGVKHNYPLLGAALKRIPGLDTPNE